ncbi:hypothetical protein [Verminephrobacter eiseniae]|nr:hypothetical protein [Verminephrobacter eiseniae]
MRAAAPLAHTRFCGYYKAFAKKPDSMRQHRRAGEKLFKLCLVSRHRSSVGLRWPSKRIAALHRLPIQLGMGCAMRLALRSDGCAQPTTSDP